MPRSQTRHNIIQKDNVSRSKSLRRHRFSIARVANIATSKKRAQPQSAEDLRGSSHPQAGICFVQITVVASRPWDLLSTHPKEWVLALFRQRGDRGLPRGGAAIIILWLRAKCLLPFVGAKWVENLEDENDAACTWTPAIEANRPERSLSWVLRVERRDNELEGNHGTSPSFHGERDYHDQNAEVIS
jgi:hypothetical protein